MQTPLFGGENPTMNETDWSGALPKPKDASITPNVYAEQARIGMTPGATPGATPSGGATPSVAAGGRTPGRGGMTTPGGATPGGASSAGGLRDGLLLNQGEEDDMMPPKMKKARVQMQIQTMLKTLPAPINEVEISMPELEAEQPLGEAPLEEDAADADRRRERQEQQRLEVELAKRSQPVQRDLPRPPLPQQLAPPDEAQAAPAAEGEESTQGSAASLSQRPASKLMQRAEALLFEEMVALATHDAFHFPMKGARPPKKGPELEDIQPAELKAADALLGEEAAALVAAAGGAEVLDGALRAAAEEGSVDLAFVPRERKYLDWRMMNKADRLEARTHQFKVAEAQLQKDAKRAKKLEEKLERVLGGYIIKARQAAQKVGALAEERETVAVESEVFRTLSAREDSAIKSRVEDLEEQVQQEKDRNARIQARYKKLKSLAQDLDEKLQ